MLAKDRKDGRGRQVVRKWGPGIIHDGEREYRWQRARLRFVPVIEDA
jgi:hypothetical protein